MKKDQPLTLEEKVDAIMAALSRIEGRHIAFRRVIVPQRIARLLVPQPPEQSEQGEAPG